MKPTSSLSKPPTKAPCEVCGGLAAPSGDNPVHLPVAKCRLCAATTTAIGAPCAFCGGECEPVATAKCERCGGVTLADERDMAPVTLTLTKCARCGNHSSGPCAACDEAPMPVPIPARLLGRKIVTRAVAISRAAFDQLSHRARAAFFRNGGKILN